MCTDAAVAWRASLAADDKTTGAAIANLGQVVSIIWMVVWTACLSATSFPVAVATRVRVRKVAARRARNEDSTQDIWLKNNGVELGFAEVLLKVLAMFGPLATALIPSMEGLIGVGG